MLNQVAPVKEDRKGPLLFRPCSHEKPLGGQDMGYSLAFHGDLWGFGKTLHKTPTKKGPFAEGIPLGLLVRFLWANKENEHDHRVKRGIAK